ncbi:MAG: hypothetical protein VZR14_09070 [Hallerella sp.]|nr:hypothetical protein [Hallerella sp.]
MNTDTDAELFKTDELDDSAKILELDIRSSLDDEKNALEENDSSSLEEDEPKGGSFTESESFSQATSQNKIMQNKKGIIPP